MSLRPPRALAAGRPAASRTAFFTDASDDDLLGYGVPVEWLDDVRAATEDTLLDLADHLPGEAAEALLQLATGGAPDRPAPAVAGADPFAPSRTGFGRDRARATRRTPSACSSGRRSRSNGH